MRVPFIIVIFYLGISAVAYTQRSNRKPFKTDTDIATAHDSIAVIKFIPNVFSPYNYTYKPATLSQEEMGEIDSLMNCGIADHNERLSENLREGYAVDFKKYKYKRQYVAVINSRGEKEVWVNCFCGIWDSNWKKEIIYVDDGGNCFFNLKINLSKKTFFDFVVNGYA